MIGRIQPQHLDELKTQASGNSADLIVNLEDVTLVAVQTVRFWGACQRGGIRLRNCPLYIQEWILRSANT
jgi:hypothetical protein